MKEITIISIEKKPRSKKYNVITSEDDYTFSEDMIIKYHIFKDKVFTKKEFDQILEDSVVDEYFNKILNLLSISIKSEYEVRKYISDLEIKNKNKLNKNKKEDLISRLKELGYLNDETLVNHLVDYYYRNNKGPLFIKQKLHEKKVEDNLLNKVNEYYTIEMEKEKIDYIISKEKNDSYTIKKFKLNLINKLLRNGFNSGIVYRKVEDLEVIDNSESLIEKDFIKVLNKVEKKDKTDYEKKQYVINSLLQKGYEYNIINNYIKNKL